MDGATNRIAEKVQELSDLELAALLCLIAGEHCIIEAEPDLVDAVGEELQLICGDVFGLSCAVLDCSQSTSLDDFGNGLLVSDYSEDYFSAYSEGATHEYIPSSSTHSRTDRRPARSPGLFSPLDSRRIANVVIAKNLNKAHEQVQIQALELVRGKRIFTRTAVQVAPKRFLFVAVLAESSKKLTPHLNDHFFISHHHLVEDGLPNLEERKPEALATDDGASESSVVRTPAVLSSLPSFSGLKSPLLSKEELDALVALAASVSISSEVRAYLHNIVVFMRLHRAVAGGVSSLATRHFKTLVRTLAPLHSLTYVSPSLVALAARKIYPHRIVLTKPEHERSMQWGSSLEAVREVLDGITVEDVIDEVLDAVEVPL